MAVVGFAAVTLATPRADAEDCKRERVAEPETSGYLLAPARTHELWTHLSFAGDWAARGIVAPAFGFGLEWVPFVSLKQDRRLGLYGGVFIGQFGDDKERPTPFGLEVGPRFRWSPVMNDFADGYILVKAGVPIQFDPTVVGLRPGIGVGARAARVVQLEASFDPVIALGDAFPSGRRVGLGAGVSLGVDLCLFTSCDRPKPKPAETHARSCEVYAEAARACAEIPERAELCAAIGAALDVNADDAYPDPATPAVPYVDYVDAFLRGTATRLKDGKAKTRIGDLRTRHLQVRESTLGARFAERKARADGVWTIEHCTYEPTVLELRAALGCSASEQPAPCGEPNLCEVIAAQKKKKPE